MEVVVLGVLSNSHKESFEKKSWVWFSAIEIYSFCNFAL